MPISDTYRLYTGFIFYEHIAGIFNSQFSSIKGHATQTFLYLIFKAETKRERSAKTIEISKGG